MLPMSALVFRKRVTKYASIFFTFNIIISLSPNILAATVCGNACNDFYLIYGSAISIIYIAFVVALMSIVYCRLFNLGLSQLWCVFVFVCLVADAKFAIFLVAHFYKLFLGGFSHSAVPEFLIAAIAFIIFLCLDRSSPNADDRQSFPNNSRASKLLTISSAITITAIAAPMTIIAVEIMAGSVPFRLEALYANALIDPLQPLLGYICVVVFIGALYYRPRPDDDHGKAEVIHPIDQKFGS